MSPRPLITALCLGLALGALAGPLRAADPSSEPAAATPAGRSIHAEMLEEHAGETYAFAEGGVPAPARATSAGDGAVTTTEATGATATWANGLRADVLGYLPYWLLTSPDLGALDYGLVSTIAYFSVGANPDGTLAKLTSSGTPTSGWGGWTSSAMTEVITRAHERDVRVVLTVTMMAWDGDYTDMTALLGSEARRKQLATEIANAVKSRNADGVNLDFEPMPNSLETSYTAFVRAVKSELVRVGAGSSLSVATTAGAVRWDEGYEVVDSNGDGIHLTSTGGADALMVMAYDLNWSGSQRAGGVAPIESPYVLDVESAMADFLAVVPASRIIWGVPYYGRAWTTQTGDRYSLTCRTSAVCPDATPGSGAIGRSWAPRYVDALEAIAVHGRAWDDIGRVPWYRYRSSTYGTWVQGYYDDAASLSEKYDLVNLNDLRGVGIWHLLMDGSRRELWEQIDTSFQGPWFEDIIGNPFRYDILWIANAGITAGCGVELFCPKRSVTREQMASFLARALALPAASRDFFTDDGASAHQGDINRLAAAGITAGCAPGRFCPDGVVTREQMASFLARALALPAASRDFFTDDEASAHEGDINRLAASGITGGCAEARFCGTAPVLREQMAAFLHRAFD